MFLSAVYQTSLGIFGLKICRKVNQKITFSQYLEDFFVSGNLPIIQFSVIFATQII